MKMLSKSVAATCVALAWSIAGAGDAQNVLPADLRVRIW
jgi:hypothetical protein